MLLELQQYLFWICFVILVNMTTKFRQFQKIHTCLTSCQTTSGAPINDLVVAFCTHFIFRKSHERTAPNAEQKFLLIQKLSWVFFLPPSAIRGLKRLLTYLLVVTCKHASERRLVNLMMLTKNNKLRSISCSGPLK